MSSTVAIATLCLLGQPPRSAASPAMAEGPAPAVVVTERVPAEVVVSTLIACSHDTPPPWKRGNCFSLSPLARGDLLKPDLFGRTPPIADRCWSVINMHRENFEEAVKAWDPKTVEVLRVGDRWCLVTDRRISGEWLLESPCAVCIPATVRDEVMAKHAARFRRPN